MTALPGEIGHLKPQLYTPSHLIRPDIHERPLPTPSFPPPNLLDLIGYTQTHPDVESTAGGLPRPDLLPRSDVLRAANEVLASPNIPTSEVLQYGGSMGNLRYRSMVSEDLTSLTGTRVVPENVVTTAGGQHAISLFLEATFGPGNPYGGILLTNSDTYAAAIGAAQKLNIPVAGLKTDEHGLDPDKLADTLSYLHSLNIPAAVYTMAVFNPTGGIMPDSRGDNIARICEENGAPGVMDYAYRYLLFDPSGPEPHLPYLGRKGVSAVFSNSKIIAPGLRTSHLVSLDPNLIAAVSAAKRDGVIMTPPLNELIVWKLMNDPSWLEERKRRVVAAYREGRDAALAAIERNSDVFKADAPKGGMFLYPELPPGFSTYSMLPRMLTGPKIAYVPGPWTQAGQLIMPDGKIIGEPLRDNRFRSCFTTLPPDVLGRTLDKQAVELRQIAREQGIVLFT